MDSFCDPAGGPGMLQLAGFAAPVEFSPSDQAVENASQSGDGAELAPRGRHLPPTLGAAHAVAAARFRQELKSLARVIAEFPSFVDGRITEKAERLGRYGITTTESFRATDETPRRFLLVCLRKAGNPPPPPAAVLPQAGAPYPLMIRRCMGGTFVLPRWILTLLEPLFPKSVEVNVAFPRPENGQLRTTRDGHCGVERPPSPRT